MQNMWGAGLVQSLSDDSQPHDLHYRKKTIFYLFKLEIPLHLNFKYAANTL